MLYAITNRRLYGTSEAQQRTRLLDQTAVWVANGVALIQLREKDMSAREQVELARAMMDIIRTAPNESGYATRLLINNRPDVALAAGAHGMHLSSAPGTLTPDEVRSIYAAADRNRPPYISMSCHTLQQVEAARQQQLDCILFAPVFEKRISWQSKDPQTLPGTGLASLKQACQLAALTPVFALGGVTTKNAPQCIQAGAAGVAAIRMMLEPASAWRPIA